MVYHVLTPLNAKNLPRFLIFYDTETRWEQVENGELHTLKLGVAMFVQLDKNLNIIKEDSIVFHTKEEFFDYVESKARKSKCYTLYIFAHNQHADFNIIDGFRELSLRGWKISRHNYDRTAFYIFWEKNDYKLCFLDSLNFFRNSSIKELGRLLGIPKLEIDFTSCTEEELETYCRRDVEILKLTILRYLEFLREHDLGRFCITVALQSLTAYRHRFMHHEILIHDWKHVIELERDSYRGGMVQCFKLGDCGRAYKLDINSAYPYQMRNQPLPTRLIRFLHNPSPQEFWYYFDRYLCIGEFLIEVKEPCIGVKRNKKLIFPVGRFWATLTSPEIWYLINSHDAVIYKVKKVAFYDYDILFEDYVDFFYGLKKQYTEEGNRVYRELSKTFLNALSGKFGQIRDETVTIEEEDEEPPAFFFYQENNKETSKIEKTFRLGRQKITYLHRDPENAYNSFVPIISFITAYQRVYLWELIKKAGRENVFLTDTDSLIVNEKGYNNLKDLIGDELGMLKLEGVENLYVNNLKDYVFGEDVKMKGIPHGSKQIAPNIFIVKHWFTTKQLLEHNLFGCVFIRYEERILRRVYEKGIVQVDGWVQPFKLLEAYC